MAKVSLEKDKIKILLLEGVHPSAIEVLQQAGYSNIEYHKGSLSGDELISAIEDAHFVGIRSRTQLTEEVFSAAQKLIAVGCFCIGTNQVDLDAAAKRGIRYSTRRSPTPVVWLSWYWVKSCCYYVGSLRKMPKPTAASGSSQPITPSKPVASAWVLSVMVTSVPNWVSWLKTSG